MSNGVTFFDSQFRRQVRNQNIRLNPFELRALPCMERRAPEFGCGQGNLTVAAARRGRDLLHAEFRDFDAPHQSIKSFVTIIARKPGPAPA